MKQRGPGELTGVKQSGIPDFAFLNVVDDYKIFVVARDDARKIIANKKNEEYKYLLSHCLKSIGSLFKSYEHFTRDGFL